LKRILDAVEQRAAVVVDLIDLAVHQAASPHDLAAEGLADGLMAETDAQEGQLAGELGDTLNRNPRFGRGAWSRRDNQPIRLTGEYFGNRDLIVAVDENFQLRINLSQPLDEVIGEGIVIVDDLNHGRSAGSETIFSVV